MADGTATAQPQLQTGAQLEKDARAVATAASDLVRHGRPASMQRSQRSRQLASLRRADIIHSEARRGSSSHLQDTGTAVSAPYLSRYSDRQLVTRLPDGHPATKPGSRGGRLGNHPPPADLATTKPLAGRAPSTLDELSRTGPLSTVQRLVLRDAARTRRSLAKSGPLTSEAAFSFPKSMLPRGLRPEAVAERIRRSVGVVRSDAGGDAPAVAHGHEAAEQLGGPYGALASAASHQAVVGRTMTPHRPSSASSGRSDVGGHTTSGRAGDAGAMRNAHRGGMGMVRGAVIVGYGHVREVTAIARRWCTVEGIEYQDARVAIRVVLMPRYFDAFALALARATRGNYGFSSELSPPLFVAEIGAAQRKRREAGQTDRDDAKLDMARQADGLASGADPLSTVDQAAGEARAGTAASTNPNRGRAKSPPVWLSHSAQDIRKHQLRMAAAETQHVVDEHFRALAFAGREAELLRLFHRGLQVRVDDSTTQMKHGRKYIQHRVRRLEAFDEAAEYTGWRDRGAQPAVDPSTGLRARVYPDVNSTDKAGNTAAILASRGGWLAVVRALLDMGADARARNAKGEDALSMAKLEAADAAAAVKNGARRAAERRKQAAELVRLLDDRSLLVCAKQGDLRRVRYLIEDAGEDANTRNTYGMTPLHFAAANLDAPMTKLLVAHGADLNARNNLGQSPSDVIEALPAGQGRAESMAAAVWEGSELFQVHAKREAVAVAEEVERMREETRLVRDLRVFTRGTTAARAVFTSFPGTAPIGPPGGRAHAAAGSEATQAEEAEARRRLGVAIQASAEAGRHATSAGGAAAGRSAHVTDHAAATIRSLPGEPSGPRAAATAKRLAARLADGPSQAATAGLKASWQRHALNFQAQRARVASSRPVSAMLRPRRTTSKAAAKPDREGAASDASRPPTALEAIAPAPDAAEFEKWMRARFGTGE